MNIPEPPLEQNLDLPPECPVCGEEAAEIYMDKWGNVVGCNQCVERIDAWEWLEEEEH